MWLNVELEARLEADPRPTASYVETVGGAVYELGRRASSDDPTSDAGGVGAGAGDADAAALRRWGILQGAVAAPAANTGSVVLSLLAAGVVGFFGGAEFGGYEYVELQPAQLALVDDESWYHADSRHERTNHANSTQISHRA